MKSKITLIQILLTIVAIIGVIIFFENYNDRSKSKKDFAALQQEVESALTVTGNGDGEVAKYSEDGKLLKYCTLYQRNNELAGWIKINDTAINYPVMYNRTSNDYYLHRNFEREKSDCGIPFLDYLCDPIINSDNMIIYSHNMRNGTMFHDLLNYKSIDYYHSHPEIMFDTMYEEGIYEIYAVIRSKVGSDDEFLYYDYIDFYEEKEFTEFVAQCKARQLYETGITPVYGDNLLTLSTCSYNTGNERFVVFARKK